MKLEFYLNFRPEWTRAEVLFFKFSDKNSKSVSFVEKMSSEEMEVETPPSSESMEVEPEKTEETAKVS